MQPPTPDAFEIPYHLRAARLRWAAFAVTLEDDELQWIDSILAGAVAPTHIRSIANLLLSLHRREDISKLSKELHISRRKLLELSDKLTTKEGRRLLLSQPQPIRGRPKKVNR